MRLKTFVLPLFLLSLVLTSLACSISVGGPDYSSLPRIPVSAEAAESIKEELRRAFEAGAETGVVTINITEPQITSYLAARMQTDPSLQQEDKTADHRSAGLRMGRCRSTVRPNRVSLPPTSASL
jgi:hypothetical protein